MVEKSVGDKGAPIELPNGVHTPYGCHRPWVTMILIFKHSGIVCTYGLSGARRVRGRVDQVYNLKNRVVTVQC